MQQRECNVGAGLESFSMLQCDCETVGLSRSSPVECSEYSRWYLWRWLTFAEEGWKKRHKRKQDPGNGAPSVAFPDTGRKANLSNLYYRRTRRHILHVHNTLVLLNVTSLPAIGAVKSPHSRAGPLARRGRLTARSFPYSNLKPESCCLFERSL